MRTEKRNFYIYDIVEAISGTLYRMAPRHRPRDIDKIMSYVIEQLELACVDVVECRYLHMNNSGFYEWLETMLTECPEFCNLNLTQNEVDKNVSVDDKSRPTYVLTSAFDKRTEDSWRDDFIDLDAAIQNISCKIEALQEEESCFLCDHHADKDICAQCKLNYAMYANRYEYTDRPHDPEKFDGWCTTSCANGFAVCCKDCRHKDTCTLEDKCKDEEFPRCPQYIVKI